MQIEFLKKLCTCENQTVGQPDVSFPQIIWINTFYSVHKYILQFAKIHLTFWKNIYCSSQKYLRKKKLCTCENQTVGPPDASFPMQTLTSNKILSKFCNFLYNNIFLSQKQIKFYLKKIFFYIKFSLEYIHICVGFFLCKKKREKENTATKTQ